MEINRLKYSVIGREYPDNPIILHNVHLPACYPNLPLLRVDWSVSLESIQPWDKISGKILVWLEAEGLKENTIVMLFEGNGCLKDKLQYFRKRFRK